MNWYKVSLKLRGPVGTLWQADTIFGHLCWVLRYRQGEDALRRFLAPFLEGKPPLLLSDGFPGDLLPRPLLLALPQATDRESFRKARNARKQVYVNHEDFLRILKGNVFVPQAPREDLPRFRTSIGLKNQINRLTGTTGGEGQLFSFTEYWTPEVTIYLKVESGYEDLVRELFRGLVSTGYGKRKSVGYGAIQSHSFDEFGGFPIPADANAFVSLSSFIPAENDPTEGRWSSRVKYGKLGEESAFTENPFKRPLLMLNPGSSFRDSPVGELYGRMVPEVSPALPDVVLQYGYALPVPYVYCFRGEE